MNRHALLARLRLLFRRDAESRMDAEFRFHMEMEVEKHIREGMSPEEARRRAAIDFGGRESHREAMRDGRSLAWLEQCARELRMAGRTLRRYPVFTVVAVIILATGIAAVTTVFSFVYAVWLRPLPHADAGRINAIGEQGRGYWQFSGVEPPAVEELLWTTTVFERISVYSEGQARLISETGVQQLRTLAVDTGFQAMLQLRPQLGRFLSHDEILGDARAAVISDTLWRSYFGADSGIIGRTIPVANERYSIVGVLEPRFRYPWQTDIFLPLPRQVLPRDAEDRILAVIAKRRPGVSPEQAQAELDVVAARLAAADSAANAGLRLLLRDEMLDRRAYSFMPMPSVFLAAGFLLLLVASSNVANLFLARAADRRAELAVRGSLGASRLRLAMQLVTEGTLIAAIAAAAGTLLSVWLVKLSLSLIPTRGFPSWIDFGLDVRILAFSILVAFVVAIVVSLTPAREGTRFNLASALKSGGDAIAGGGVRRGRRRGLMIQIATAMVLLVATGLFVRSYARVMDVELGYPAEEVAVVQLYHDPSVQRDPEAQMRFVEELLPRAQALPGARIVTARGSYGGPRATAGVRPRPTDVRPDSRILVDGDTSVSRSAGIRRRIFVVADDYFEAVGVRLLRGRLFARDDAAGSVPVVIVSRRFAERMLGGRDPLGRRVQIGASGTPHTVIGIVEDVRDMAGNRDGIRSEPQADAYFTSRQVRAWNYAILARASTRASAEALHDLIGSQARNAQSALIVGNERTLADQKDEQAMMSRIFGWLLGSLAGTALLLIVVGLYGAIAYDVSRRTREIGVRMAVGGTAGRIVRLIVGEALRLVAVGLVFGVVAAALLTRVIRSLLFGVSPLDVTTYMVAAMLFAVTALAASWLPARRASRISPLQALRAE